MLVTDSGMVTLVKVEHFANVNCRHTRGYKCQLKDLVPVVMTASPRKSVCARQLGGWFVTSSMLVKESPVIVRSSRLVHEKNAFCTFTHDATSRPKDWVPFAHVRRPAVEEACRHSAAG